MRKTDYFGTFLDTLNSSTGTSRMATSQSRVALALGAQPLSIDAVLKVWPTEAGEEMSVVEVAKTFGASLDAAAGALRTLESHGLVQNNKGMFRLSPKGREAAGLG